MFNVKTLLPVVALAAALTFALGGEAKAQHGHGWGHGHSAHVHHPVTRSHWGHGHHQSFYPSYGWRQPTFHNTSHLDFHAPQLSRHRNHLHVQPGHYDVHNTGHWHR